MVNQEKILGYDKSGKPIHPPRRGYVYTQACVSCRECMEMISSVGGPMHGSICVACHDEAWSGLPYEDGIYTDPDGSRWLVQKLATDDEFEQDKNA